MLRFVRSLLHPRPLLRPRSQPRRYARSLAMAVSAGAFYLALAGCGGTGSSAGVGSTPHVSLVTVSVAGPSTTRLGGTAQYTATVTGTGNTAVTWSVNGTAGGSPTLGTVSTTGLYTAPATLPGASVTIAATSAADASVSGSALDILQNPAPAAGTGTATQIGSSENYLVDITGSGFIPSSVIMAGGVAQTTSLISSTDIQATVTVASGTTSLAVAVSNPDPGASLSGTLKLSVTYYASTVSAAGRLLDQTSFGPTLDTIQHVQAVGINKYLQEQFAQSATKLASIPTNPLPAVCLANNSAYPCAESEWWQTVVTGPDQLRQRVAFALSEMFVVSTQAIPGQSIPQFHNALASDAFGNFATLMKDVTLAPAMGGYLNMLNSAKPAAGQIVNENYARENMQLFTMGLNKLNQDGTEQLDSTGAPIPSYTEAQVEAFARAYTGWTLANADGSTVTKFPNNSGDYSDPMAAVDKYHDTTGKTLLDGTVLSAGQTAAQDLDDALKNIFNNANVAPFVCKQLIQHLVTSTPSPGYVSRVAAVFANNGSGVRGDMKAVLTAIFLDAEARAGDTDPNYNGGHLREPLLFITAMVRGLGFTNTDPNGSYFSLSSQSSKLNQQPYRANSVFNFFPPEYVIPATALNAPEFGIENTATAVLRFTLADSIVNNKISGFTVDLSNTSALGKTAASPGDLVDTLSALLMHAQMSSAMRTILVNAITPLTSNAQRVRVALYLIVTSSQYKIIH